MNDDRDINDGRDVMDLDYIYGRYGDCFFIGFLIAACLIIGGLV